MGLRSRGNSFSYAIQGLKSLVLQEPNAKIHLMATVLVIIAGVIRDISPERWLALVFAIAIVWITEALNTCVEMLCNLFCEGQYHPVVKVIKDISAGAVLIAALASVVTAVIVFTL